MKTKLLLSVLLIFTQATYSQVCGCTDVVAANYNEKAQINDGSCIYKKVSLKPIKTFNLTNNLKETSGLIKWEKYLITHNDDTDNKLYAIDTSGLLKRIFKLQNAENVDWEDISQDYEYIYIGDFGNNACGNRKNLRILRVNKKSLFGNYAKVDTIAFSYETQTDFSPKPANQTNFDCEAFIVFKDSIYMFTKEWISQKTSVFALPKCPGTYNALHVNTFNIKGLITGATHHENKNIIALCGYSKTLQPFIYLLYDFKKRDFFSGNKRKIYLSLPFRQIEGIATENACTYYLTNEQFVKKPIIGILPQLHIFDLSPYLKLP